MSSSDRWFSGKGPLRNPLMSANGNGRQSVNLIAAHVLVALTVILCATVLVALGKLKEEAAVTLYGAAIGLTGGAAGAIVTGRYGLPSGSTITTPPPTGQTSKTTTEVTSSVPETLAN